ncbi:BspA family leucine-rich repeat surface protein [Alloprevotella sp. oral taxon 473]|uniref:BspA family leucine-rich repeat surface protein n=1 Tax=Alloprevotella sp. oral taxon 473 TaxID=712469 RepID=UPI0002A1FE23|nr:BspA family leucine-rich repeat surface protein [Alloprevotella sp. oral taxon 473]EKX93175.1 bacterial surface protein 26-residue PARCEL repeat-containing domain protein [Alloprevotella sp. oral taxon 473 str. F0040]
MRIHTLHTLCATIVALVCSIVAFPQRSQAQEAYVHQSTDKATLTFFYDTQRSSRDGTTWGINDQKKEYDTMIPAWTHLIEGEDSEWNTLTTKAVFDASFKDFRPTTTSYWFSGFKALQTIEGLENLNTSEVINMSYMFADCPALTTLDLKNFNTEKVKDMNSMFTHCVALTSLDLKNFNTEKVTDMSHLFSNCATLTALDLSRFNTAQVTDMNGMFKGCAALTHCSLVSFNTEKVTDMRAMFSGCRALPRLDVDKFSLSATTKVSEMFKDCAALQTLFSNKAWTCGESDGMFAGCLQLKGAVSFNDQQTTAAMANPTTGYFAKKMSEAYVVEDDNAGTLTFFYDANYDQYEEPKWKIVDAKTPEGKPLVPWINNNSNTFTNKIIIHPSFKDYRPTTTARWFSACTNLTALEGMEYLNTSQVTDMSGMFAGAIHLKAIDLSHFDTEKVTNMSEMFAGCKSLSSLDLTTFNTSKVTDMSEMFAGCRDMVKANVSSFNTAAVTTLDMMFAGCSSLTSLDLTHFNTTNVTDMGLLFGGCSSLQQLDLSSFNTSNVTDMGFMFNECTSLKQIDVSHFNTAKVTNMSDMFRGCSTLQQIDLSHFNTAKVTSMSDMFNECTSLKHLDLSNFNTEQLTYTYKMFNGCSALESLDLTHFVLSDQTEADMMFKGCSSLRTIYCSNSWKCRTSTDMFKDCLNLQGAMNYDEIKTGVTMATPTTGYFTIKPQDKPEVKTPEAYAHQSEDQKTLTFYYDKLRASRKGHTWGINETKVMQNLSVPAWAGTWEVANETTTKVVFDASFQEVRPTTTAYWFLHYKALTDLQGLEHLNTSQVTDMTAMFSRCLALSTLDLSSFNTKQVTNMGLMFSECIALKQLNLSGFNTENVTNMMYLFNECAALEKIDLTHFNTSSVTNMYGLFDGCKSLTTLDLKSFNTSGVNDMSRMFSGCQALTQIDLSNFNTANVTNMSYMFNGCAALAQLDLSSFNTANVTNMSYMFSRCAALESLDLSHFNTTNVVEMTRMFSESKKLAHIQCLDSWQCPQSAQMFEGCLKLKGAVDYDDSKTDVTMANPETGYFSKYPTAIDHNFLKAHKAQGIYTLQGKRVNGSLQHLPAGVYIVNGKKVVVGVRR